jgi:hypothetical protein
VAYFSPDNWFRMLPLNIEEVGPDHIASLVDNKVSERKVLEYKERLPETSDGAKKEFLGDVSSFANSSGGDIIYGIQDRRDSAGKATGVPEAIVGLTGVNLSAEITRLESLIRDGIRPRVANLQIKDIDIQGKGSVVLLRIGRSWLKPHMVTYGGTSRFFARHATGKYQLDVQEIGQLFAEQRSVGEELRNWRSDRVARLLSDEAPAPWRVQLNSSFTSSQLGHFWGARARGLGPSNGDGNPLSDRAIAHRIFHGDTTLTAF